METFEDPDPENQNVMDPDSTCTALVPLLLCKTVCMCGQVSKAVVLQKSIDYLQYLSQQKKKQEADLATLKKVKISLNL